MEMTRRNFFISAAAAFFSALLSGLPDGWSADRHFDISDWRPGSPLDADGPEPKPEITAAVDALVPSDPDVPDDFKGSDFKADYVVASALGTTGQAAVVFFLNQYARRTSGRKLITCTSDEKLEASKAWVRDRETLQPLLKDILSGLVSLAVIGTYENNSEQEQRKVFAAMGWYDPNDPSGTFRIPNEGYPDSFQFPARLKKGIKE